MMLLLMAEIEDAYEPRKSDLLKLIEFFNCNYSGEIFIFSRHCEEGRSPDEAISLRETVRRLLCRHLCASSQ